MQKLSEPLHPDFQKILRQFKKRYGAKLGQQYFWGWVKNLGLNPEKPYGEWKEKFSWAEPHFDFFKQDSTAKYYKVEALFPLSSMNRNVYTEDELIRATRTLVGKPVNLNHRKPSLQGVDIEDAEFEDGAAELILRVENEAVCPRNSKMKIQKLIDNGEIMHVSIEARCKRGRTFTPDGSICSGLIFTGLALLTRNVLPGVPLTRIEPVERIVENFTVTGELEMKEKEEKSETENAEAKWTTAYINDLPDSSFAYIQPGGKKDDQGKTVPRTLRNLPYKDAQGNIDLPHLRNALARLPQTKLSDQGKAQAKRALCAAAKKVGLKSEVCGLECKEPEKPEKKEKTVRKQEKVKREAQRQLEMADLKYKLQHLKEEISGLQGKYEKASAALTEAQMKIEQLEETNKRLQSHVTSLQEQLAAEQQTVAQLNVSTGQLQNELQRQLEALGSSQALNEELNKKYAATLASNVTLTKETATLKEEVVNLTRRCEELQGKLKKVKRVGRIIVKV